MPDETTHNPTPGTPGTLHMPPAEDMAVQAVSELVTDGYSSSVMKLSRPTLNELGRRLIQPGVDINDAAVKWLEEEGHTIPRTNVYRFAQRFREVYRGVWARWADKLIFAQLAADPAFDNERLQGLIKSRLHTIVAQEVLTADPSELDTARMTMILSLVTAADKGRLEAQKLDLARRTAEQRAEKLEAEIEKIKLDNDERVRRIEAAAANAKQTVDKAASKGRQLSREDVYTLIDQVVKGGGS